MKKLLSVLTELKSNGLIADYALGGATALTYYLEPVQTQDIDIFIVLSNQEDQLINLAPIYDFISKKGIKTDREYLLFDDTPVQFLVPYNPLVEEAVREAKSIPFQGESIPIPPLEYLMTIMLQTDRPKDRIRLHEIFTLPELFDLSILTRIAERFGLKERLNKYTA